MWKPTCMENPEEYRRQCDAIDEPVLTKDLLKIYYKRREIGYSERLNYETIKFLHEYLYGASYPSKVRLRSIVRAIGDDIAEMVSDIEKVDESGRKSTVSDAISAALFGFGYVKTGKNGLYRKSR